MKREKKGGISYDRYADVIASGAITLESYQSDAIMHRMKTEGQARKLSKASLLSALLPSQRGCFCCQGTRVRGRKEPAA
jgi:hypothetical protein